MSKIRNGFTIAELLIVIVVIAILASITITAYNGIQTRSNNAQTISAVKEYAKMLVAYKADTGNWPTYSGNGCLGLSPCGLMTGDNTNAPCDMGQGKPISSGTLDSIFKQALGNTNLPLASSQEMSCGTATYRGIWFWTDSSTTRRITYYLKGDETCPMFTGVTSIQRVQNADTTRCATFFNGT